MVFGYSKGKDHRAQGARKPVGGAGWESYHMFIEASGWLDGYRSLKRSLDELAVQKMWPHERIVHATINKRWIPATGSMSTPPKKKGESLRANLRRRRRRRLLSLPQHRLLRSHRRRRTLAHSCELLCRLRWPRSRFAGTALVPGLVRLVGRKEGKAGRLRRCRVGRGRSPRVR